MLWILILVIIVAILIKQQSDLNKENSNLKLLLNNRNIFCPKCGFYLRMGINFCPKCGFSFNRTMPINDNCHNGVEEKEQQLNLNKEKSYTDKELKNNFILIIGSVLIVLSAIIFLFSTWNSTNNIFKLVVILFMLMLFLFIGYASDKFLDLKRTSMAFYYIALAYIPIVLLSISRFGLLGDYYSLFGPGRYIYLTICSIVVYFIYYFVSKKRKNNLIFIFSILFQVFSLIFFTLIFTTNFYMVLLTILIYSIIISGLFVFNKFYFNKSIHKILSIVFCIVMSVLVIFANFYKNLFGLEPWINVITTILMVINIYLVVEKIFIKEKIYNYIYPLLIIYMFNIFSYMFDNMIYKQLLILISFIVVGVYNLFRENKLNLISYIEMLVSFIYFNLIWIVISLFNVDVLDYYIIFGTFAIISLLGYLFNDKYKKFFSYMFIALSIISIFSLVIELNLSINIVGYLLLCMLLVSMYVKKIDINLKQAFKCLGIIFLIFIALFNMSGSIGELTLYALVILFSYLYGIKEKDSVYKIISYVFANVFLFKLFNFIEFKYTEYIIPLTTILIIITEIILNKIKSKSSHIYLIIQYILSIIILIDILNIYGFITILIMNLCFVYYIKNDKQNDNYLYIPFIGTIPYLYFNNNFIINNFNIMYIVSIFILLILWWMVIDKKKNIYVTVMFIYTIMHILYIEQIKYIGIVLLILSSLSSYLIKQNKIKDFFKSLIYFFVLVLYKFIISDLGLNSITAISCGIYFIFILLLTRTILKKYGNEYKVWEYILFAFVSLINVFNCNNIYDSIIYLIFLTILVIIFYILRYGPAFLVCLISILIYIILLSENIFINIPWWIYVLLIGGVLIGFAIYNEVKDNRNKEENINKKIKEHLDL